MTCNTATVSADLVVGFVGSLVGSRKLNRRTICWLPCCWIGQPTSSHVILAITITFTHHRLSTSDASITLVMPGCSQVLTGCCTCSPLVATSVRLTALHSLLQRHSHTDSITLPLYCFSTTVVSSPCSTSTIPCSTTRLMSTTHLHPLAQEARRHLTSIPPLTLHQATQMQLHNHHTYQTSCPRSLTAATSAVLDAAAACHAWATASAAIHAATRVASHAGAARQAVRALPQAPVRPYAVGQWADGV